METNIVTEIFIDLVKNIPLVVALVVALKWMVKRLEREQSEKDKAFQLLIDAKNEENSKLRNDVDYYRKQDEVKERQLNEYTLLLKSFLDQLYQEIKVVTRNGPDTKGP